jgi:hypothetical protein
MTLLNNESTRILFIINTNTYMLYVLGTLMIQATGLFPVYYELSLSFVAYANKEF